MKLPDAVRRSIRTFVQAATGVMVLQAGAVAIDAGKGTYVPDVDWLKRIAVSAVAAGVIACVTYVHNALEDNTGMPAVLKATASSGENPVTRDPAT